MPVQQIKTGDITARLGMTVTSDLIINLGFPPDARDKRATLWDEAKWPAICDAIAGHVVKQKKATTLAVRKGAPAPAASVVDDDDDL